MPDKMNPEVKAQWTAALRSGEYEQGHNALANSGRYCCLGVLCELAVKAEVIPAPVEGHDGDMEYGDEAESLFLPPKVAEWAQIESSPTADPDGFPEGVQWDTDGPAGLANLNDGGTPFAVIADIIDQQF